MKKKNSKSKKSNKKPTFLEEIRGYLEYDKWTDFLKQEFPSFNEIQIISSVFKFYLTTPKKIKCDELQEMFKSHGDYIENWNIRVTVVAAISTKERLMFPSSFSSERIEFIKECCRPLNLDETIINKIIEHADTIEIFIAKEKNKPRELPFMIIQ